MSLHLAFQLIISDGVSCIKYRPYNQTIDTISRVARVISVFFLASMNIITMAEHVVQYIRLGTYLMYQGLYPIGEVITQK